MKLNGIVGKGSGKLGASVFAISGGEQIVRQYNPQVTNPNTNAQVAQRAKLKLISQLAAALAPGLAFKKKGLISARNQFVSKNIGLCTYSSETASCILAALQLTDGTPMLEDLTVTRGTGDKINVSLAANPNTLNDRVVYVVAEKTTNEQLRIVAIKNVVAGNNHDFATEIDASRLNLVVFAYGLRFTSAQAAAMYGDYVASGGETDASISTLLRNMITNSVTTHTSGVEVASVI